MAVDLGVDLGAFDVPDLAADRRRALDLLRDMFTESQREMADVLASALEIQERQHQAEISKIRADLTAEFRTDLASARADMQRHLDQVQGDFHLKLKQQSLLQQHYHPLVDTAEPTTTTTTTNPPKVELNPELKVEEPVQDLQPELKPVQELQPDLKPVLKPEPEPEPEKKEEESARLKQLEARVDAQEAALRAALECLRSDVRNDLESEVGKVQEKAQRECDAAMHAAIEAREEIDAEKREQLRFESEVREMVQKLRGGGEKQKHAEEEALAQDRLAAQDAAAKAAAYLKDNVNILLLVGGNIIADDNDDDDGTQQEQQKAVRRALCAASSIKYEAGTGWNRSYFLAAYSEVEAAERDAVTLSHRGLTNFARVLPPRLKQASSIIVRASTGALPLGHGTIDDDDDAYRREMEARVDEQLRIALDGYDVRLGARTEAWGFALIRAGSPREALALVSDFHGRPLSSLYGALAGPGLLDLDLLDRKDAASLAKTVRRLRVTLTEQQKPPTVLVTGLTKDKRTDAAVVTEADEQPVAPEQQEPTPLDDEKEEEEKFPPPENPEETIQAAERVEEQPEDETPLTTPPTEAPQTKVEVPEISEALQKKIETADELLRRLETAVAKVGAPAKATWVGPPEAGIAKLVYAEASEASQASKAIRGSVHVSKNLIEPPKESRQGILKRKLLSAVRVQAALVHMSNRASLGGRNRHLALTRRLDLLEDTAGRLAQHACGYGDRIAKVEDSNRDLHNLLFRLRSLDDDDFRASCLRFFGGRQVSDDGTAEVKANNRKDTIDDSKTIEDFKTTDAVPPKENNTEDDDDTDLQLVEAEQEDHQQPLVEQDHQVDEVQFDEEVQKAEEEEEEEKQEEEPKEKQEEEEMPPPQPTVDYETVVCSRLAELGLLKEKDDGWILAGPVERALSMAHDANEVLERLVGLGLLEKLNDDYATKPAEDAMARERLGALEGRLEDSRDEIETVSRRVRDLDDGVPILIDEQKRREREIVAFVTHHAERIGVQEERLKRLAGTLNEKISRPEVKALIMTDLEKLKSEVERNRDAGTAKLESDVDRLREQVTRKLGRRDVERLVQVAVERPQPQRRRQAGSARAVGRQRGLLSDAWALAPEWASAKAAQTILAAVTGVKTDLTGCKLRKFHDDDDDDPMISKETAAQWAAAAATAAVLGLPVTALQSDLKAHYNDDDQPGPLDLPIPCPTGRPTRQTFSPPPKHLVLATYPNGRPGALRPLQRGPLSGTPEDPASLSGPEPTPSQLFYPAAGPTTSSTVRPTTVVMPTHSTI